MERIGIGPRIGAALIDVVCLILVAIPLGFVFGLGSATAISDQPGGSWFGAVIVAIIMLGYWTLEIFKAQSPGKRALGLAIKNQDGSNASQEVLIKRFLIKQVSGILNLLTAITTIGAISMLGNIAGLIVFIGFFMVLRESKQALHDQLSETAVFKVAKTSSDLS